ncbi:MAG TPA: ATP-binding protein [Nocardia sp.]|uniref:sensor histidine kinase n=1 Tax=Nocardia sp. TaxID=1821 RepID=UPI002B4B957E|nr:ATP-binding protein [Nocardia sp.]HLS75763.1 ATP-binding protein [Nocardia sp.]
MATDTAPVALSTDEPAPSGRAGSPERAENTAEERITRLFARFIGSGYLCYLLLLIPDITREAAALAPWWTVFALPAVFGPPIAAGLLSFRRQLDPARHAAAASAIGYAAAAFAWPLAWDGTLLTGDQWMSYMPGLAALAAAVACPPVPTLLALVVCLVPVELINYHCRIPELRGVLVPDMMFAMAFCLLYVAAALMAMRTGRLLDRTRAQAHAAAAAAAATTARNVQRARYNALMHDWVMSTLLAAARRTDRAEVRRQAELAIAKLGELEPENVASYPGRALIASLRTAVADVDDTVRVEATVWEGCEDEEYPAEPVRVLGAALAEAVRNSVRHAGPEGQCRVRATLAPGLVEVMVVDDGVGFDLGAIAPHRLGVRVSIIGRLRELPGGAVDVLTAPGKGTTVRMAWRGAS